MQNENSIQTKADTFAYITFKMQSIMHTVDNNFYSENMIVERIYNCVHVCAKGNLDLIQDGKDGVINAFNRLKNEENLSILSYDTITSFVKKIDEKVL